MRLGTKVQAVRVACWNSSKEGGGWGGGRVDSRLIFHTTIGGSCAIWKKKKENGVWMNSHEINVNGADGPLIQECVLI